MGPRQTTQLLSSRSDAPAGPSDHERDHLGVFKAKADVLERPGARAVANGWHVRGGAEFAGGGDVCQAVIRVAHEPKA